jgi:EAL domain-containing protein (putative c-di-GMP-specific phosphodiesterase class I)
VAKEQGRNCVHVFHPEDEAAVEHHEKIQWIERIRSALDNNLFELHFQPIAGIDGEESAGSHGEVLLRMIDETDSDADLIPPNAFIPAAERYHLMQEIDQWVIRHTFEALASDGAALEGVDVCSVNLSGQSFDDMKLHDYILQLLDETGLDAEKICFEISESTVVTNIELARVFINKLRKRGFRFALDGFGSGFSSLGYLKDLPVDYIKLDGSLIRDVSKNRISLATVRAINYLAHVMGMKSIAGFVEDEKTVSALKSVSVNYAQGYWLGRPERFSKGQETGSDEELDH